MGLERFLSRYGEPTAGALSFLGGAGLPFGETLGTGINTLAQRQQEQVAQQQEALAATRNYELEQLRLRSEIAKAQQASQPPAPVPGIPTAGIGPLPKGIPVALFVGGAGLLLLALFLRGRRRGG